MSSDCWWGTTHGRSASCHEPPGTWHTWDSWSIMHAATNPSTPMGTKWRACMQLSLIRKALGVGGVGGESSWMKHGTAAKYCCPLPHSGGAPALAEVGQRWECRVTPSLPCLRVADSNG